MKILFKLGLMCYNYFTYKFKGRKQMKKFFGEFKKFITRGNILDMAVGVIVGGAFTAIVTALTNSIIRPFINWLLAVITGGSGLDSVYTFLTKAWTVDANGNQIIDLANSIYIDWGDFITKIIDFLIIALTIFIIVKVINSSKDYMKKAAADLEKAYPNKAERKELKKRGVNLKDRKAVKEGLAQLIKEEEERKALEEASKPVVEKQEDILKDIRALLQAQAAQNQTQDKAE